MASISRAQVYNHGGSFLGPGDIVPVKYVTVIGHMGDFAVYMGEGTDKEIAENGDKVSEKVARAVAPYCSHLKRQ